MAVNRRGSFDRPEVRSRAAHAQIEAVAKENRSMTQASGNARKGATGERDKNTDWLTLITSMVALVVSGLSLYVAYQSANDTSQVAAIQAEYALFGGFATLQYEHPLMTHLFAYTPEQYDNATKQVMAAAKPLPDEEKRKYLLEEQGIANSIFTSFEETYYFWLHSKDSAYQPHAQLLEDDMMWFARQMCNPRLAWYWDKDNGMRLSLNYALDLRTYLEKAHQKLPCFAPEDMSGPFG
jgi:hypothetical protein